MPLRNKDNLLDTTECHIGINGQNIVGKSSVRMLGKMANLERLVHEQIIKPERLSFKRSSNFTLFPIDEKTTYSGSVCLWGSDALYGADVCT